MTAPLPLKIDFPNVVVTPNGCLIHDAARRESHYLNLTAYFVYRSSDGKTTPGEMAENLRQAFELPEPPLEEVLTCIDDLRTSGLLETGAA